MKGKSKSTWLTTSQITISCSPSFNCWTSSSLTTQQQLTPITLDERERVTSQPIHSQQQIPAQMPFHTCNTWTNNLAHRYTFRNDWDLPQIECESNRPWGNTCRDADSRLDQKQRTDVISESCLRRFTTSRSSELRQYFIDVANEQRNKLKMANTQLLIDQNWPILSRATMKHSLPSSAYFARQGTSDSD